MRLSLLLACVAAAVVAIACAATPTAAQRQFMQPEDMDTAGMNALQQYVATPDPNYGWERLAQFDEAGLGYKVLWLNLTSQAWLTPADVSQSIWWHYVAVIVPQNLNSSFASKGLMYITGGNNGATPPKITSEDLIVAAVLAQTTQTVAIVLFQIPNQPIHFWAQGPNAGGKTEDALIALSWRLFLDNPNRTEFIPYFPMTKAGLRAMDAVTEFWQEEAGQNLAEWIVAGASKRGWTTWLVAACDPQRVVAFVPLVFDELNFVKNIHHHWRAYGGWSFALTDYIENNITISFDSEEFAYMISLIDPIVYADILTQPKLIVSTGGDEFLLPDNHDYYGSELQGETHFHSFPNTEHSLITNVPLVLDTVTGFIVGVQTNTPRPVYNWVKQPNGALHIEVDAATPPKSVTVWSTTTVAGAERRDFRLVALTNTTSGMKPWVQWVLWTQSPELAATSSNSSWITYDFLGEAPASGAAGDWAGFVIEMIWDGALNNTNFRVSTAVSILPQTFPYPDCYADSCAGPLV